MQFLKNMAKGAVIGISNIIPGVSGGTMAVTMGIYDRLIYCLTHLFKEFKKSLKFLLPILLGAAVALVAGSFGIEYLFQKFPVPTNLFFIGLILGGMPMMTKKVKGQKIRAGHMVTLFIFFVLVAGLALFGDTEGKSADLSFHFLNVLILFLIGVITSATMVIPGVSGSMILLLLGYYNPIIEQINDFIRSLTGGDWQGVLTGCGVLIPFGIGVVIGIFAIAKLIEVIFQKFPLYANWAIIGLIAASPFAIVFKNLAGFAGVTALTVLGSIVTFAAGFFIAMKLGE